MDWVPLVIFGSFILFLVAPLALVYLVQRKRRQSQPIEEEDTEIADNHEMGPELIGIYNPAWKCNGVRKETDCVGT